MPSSQSPDTSTDRRGDGSPPSGGDASDAASRKRWLRRDVIGTTVLGGAVLGGGALALQDGPLFGSTRSRFEAVVRDGDRLLVVGHEFDTDGNRTHRIVLSLDEGGDPVWQVVSRIRDEQPHVQAAIRRGQESLITLEEVFAPASRDETTRRPAELRGYEEGRLAASVRFPPAADLEGALAIDGRRGFAVGRRPVEGATDGYESVLWGFRTDLVDDPVALATSSTIHLNGVAVEGDERILTGSDDDGVVQQWTGTFARGEGPLEDSWRSWNGGDPPDPLDLASAVTGRTHDPGTVGSVVSTRDGYVAGAGGSTVSGVRGLTAAGETRWQSDTRFVSVDALAARNGRGWALVGEGGDHETVLQTGDGDGRQYWRTDLTGRLETADIAAAPGGGIVAVGQDAGDTASGRVLCLGAHADEQWAHRYSPGDSDA
ncbi:hypothetical protein [Haloarchaeobius amylolyticus]|uniref:hypothetical protein n=1 Tax=Haloarchaeobius amylolyticus TaxID=1198296 RepID=UPI0022709EE2|nr:hypothetical protein [Haloarchaeobius amylolyticus]